MMEARHTSTSERRQAQLDALVDAAERRIATGGIKALKARDLAAEIGIALGGLYNLVPDLDELALRVSSRTLNRLGEALTATADRWPLATPDDAVNRLVAIAQAYLAFARGNLSLWRTLFELRLAGDAVLPEWAANDQLRLFHHIAEPLAVLLPQQTEAGRGLTARTLFAAVHGIVVIGLEDRLIAVPPQALNAQIEWLVRATCRGFST
ncbi:TetR/AcrR family transcriptional regulator [Oryzibacter oryziterrae]|uniref:TetR/AcrR family transcriptional regulator n=1 Tax=Oryzibacter oryziterrae TaxID=2766474 RepID=UPI001F3634C1|nr:WHG domain-containing protein [Oryzibacter oryziterrae]